MPHSLSAVPLPPQSESNLWRRLLRSLVIAPNRSFIDPSLIGSQRDVVCPEDTAVNVRTTATERVPIHANIINFVRRRLQPGRNQASPTDAPKHCAKAGQSPQDFARCAKFLVEGLEHGQGLFQFISRKAHAVSIDPTKAKTQERSIIDQLLDEWEQCGKEPGKLQLAERYEVIQVEQHPPQANHQRVMLTVRDLEDSSKTITVPLTQAGLKFTDRLLRQREIETANTLLEDHRQLCVNALAPDGSLPTADPMIISLAGIGRNAVLITYRETLARINAEPTTSHLDEHWLDDTLEDIVASGRRDRGPGFIHSDAQLQVLREGLKEVLEQRDRLASSAQLRVQSRAQSERAHRQMACQPPSAPASPPAMLAPTIEPSSGPVAPVPRAQGTQAPLSVNQMQNEQPQRAIIAPQQRPPIEPQQVPPYIAIMEQELQEEYAANDVLNRTQNRLAESGYQRDLVDRSVDITLVPKGEDCSLVEITEAWDEHLKQSHIKQQISGDGDNLCWLRSSWLPVFAMTTPEQLKDKLPNICDLSRFGAADAPILSAIAQLYHANPATFLQGSSELFEDKPQLSLDELREYKARLGPNMPLSALIEIQPNWDRRSDQTRMTPEEFLRELQFQLATALRPTGTQDPQFSFMQEIEELQESTDPNGASSNLPVTLHRALGLPVLVIETGSHSWEDENGQWNTFHSANLRVSAPKGSELAKLAQWLEEQPDLEAAAQHEILARFSDLPVIWLNGAHYSVYLPTCPPAKTQQAVMEAVQPAGTVS